MELLEGQTLKHLITGKPLEIEAVLDLGSNRRRAARGTLEKNRSPGHQAREHLRH
jgi:hypothetical protein